MSAPKEARTVSDRILDRIDEVVVGKREQAKMLLAALMVSGHVLLEDVPGVGKTLLARTFASVTSLTFKRVQFTPDLLPSDVTGTYIWSPKDSEFHWRPGPVFTNVLLADELNRATPRTQSSLLEAMEERQVTSEGDTRPLPSPFMVVATQNPIEMEGTFPLPEAQLDRFLLKIEMGYPSREQETEILRRFIDGAAPVAAAGLLPEPASESELDLLREAARRVYISPDITSYILSIAEKTREHKGLSLGVSPRGTLYLARLARAWAALDGREYVLPDDVKRMAVPCLAHRIIPKVEASLRGKTGRDVIESVLSEVPVPVGNDTPLGT